jgi:hypothetical protein
VLAPAWLPFDKIDWDDAIAVMDGALIDDARNQSPDVACGAGLEYEGTGRESCGLNRSLLESAIEA